MLNKTMMRLFAAMLLTAFCFAALSCGGGDDLPDLGGEIETLTGQIPPLVIDGPTQYDGVGVGDDKPGVGGELDDIIYHPAEAGDFGPNVFAVPLDSNGAGTIAVSNFSPGQKAAFVMVNVNAAYLDAHLLASGTFPVLPDPRFTIEADLVTKGTSSFNFADSVDYSPKEAFLSGGYSGIDDGLGITSTAVLAEREARGWGKVPYAADAGIKTTSSIQKGEIRTFANSTPRFGPPVILPGEDDPDRDDIDDLAWPDQYNSQDARLVTIGAHCLVFLSTEINGGHPDTIQYTEARLNMLAREFDTVIFPNNQNAFGPVTNYFDNSIWRDLDRGLQREMDADDFDEDGNLISFLPGLLDGRLDQEEKIVILIHNADAGGFFSWTTPNPEDIDDPDLVSVGSTLYIGGDNFPANDNGWEAVYSVIAHEFQHKLFADNALPKRDTDGYLWINEGLSMLAFHINGYTVNSGNIIDWAIDGQLTDYLNNINASAIPMDANDYFTNQTQYGGGFLFFLYLYEHYDQGVGRRIYNAAKNGETNYIHLIEIAAQTTTMRPGDDGILGTTDDEEYITRDSFEDVYVKFALANFIDGIYSDNGEFAGSDTDVFDPRFIYNTIDLKGTVNLASGTIVLPGVRREIFPSTGTYPVTDIHRRVIPWASDYVIFGNGDGRDLEVKVYSDRNFRMFMLPVEYNPDINMVEITPGVVIN